MEICNIDKMEYMLPVATMIKHFHCYSAVEHGWTPASLMKKICMEQAIVEKEWKKTVETTPLKCIRSTFCAISRFFCFLIN